jgi:hypothetical protein
MNFKSASFAKTLILLSLVIGSTSGWYAHRQSGLNAASAARVKTLAGELGTLDAAWREMSAVLEPAAQPADALDQALARLRLRLEHLQVAHGVALSQTTLARRAGSEARPVSELAETLKGTAVHTLRVDVRGTYADYEGLLAYLREIRRDAPVAVVSLNVRDNLFELALRVYGV